MLHDRGTLFVTTVAFSSPRLMNSHSGVMDMLPGVTNRCLPAGVGQRVRSALNLIGGYDFKLGAN